MDFSRLRLGEIVAAIGGVALLGFMFLDWFEGGAVTSSEPVEIPGLGEVPSDIGAVPTDGGEVETEGLSAWDSLLDFDGFLIALSGVSAIALGGLAAAGRRLNLGGIPRGAGTAALGSLAVLLILWRLLASPSDLEFGIFLGLAAAFAIAVGALMSLRVGGFEPLVAVAGGRTRAASSASAPRTTTRRAAPKRASGSRSGGSKSGSRAKSSSRSKGSSSSRSSSTRKRSTGGKK